MSENFDVDFFGIIFADPLYPISHFFTSLSPLHFYPNACLHSRASLHIHSVCSARMTALPRSSTSPLAYLTPRLRSLEEMGLLCFLDKDYLRARGFFEQAGPWLRALGLSKPIHIFPFTRAPARVWPSPCCFLNLPGRLSAPCCRHGFARVDRRGSPSAAVHRPHSRVPPRRGVPTSRDGAWGRRLRGARGLTSGRSARG